MTKQGGQTGPTFHQTLVFKMLGEMFDLFDRGLTDLRHVRQWAIQVSISQHTFEIVQ